MKPCTISLFPVISRKFNKSREDGLLFFKKCIGYLVIAGIIVGGVIFVASPYIISIFLGGEFQEAIPLLRLFSLLPCLIIIASTFTIQGLYGMQMQKYAPFVGFIIGFFCVFLYFILIPQMGLIGAVITYLIAEVLEILLVIFFLMKFNRIT